MGPGRVTIMAMRPTLPPAAAAWLTGDQPARVVVVGAGGPYAGLLSDQGNAVAVVDKDPAALDRLVQRRPDIGGVVGRAEGLPLHALTFDRLICVQNLHSMAPGLALAEFARVLAPGGALGVVYLSRDDSVPWVRRLTSTVQQVLPDAMKGAYGEDSVHHVEESSYFPRVEQQTYRLWIPSHRQGLIDMALAAPGAGRLGPEAKENLAEAVGAVYDSAARPPEPLLLPYKLSCWRAWVDHNEMTMGIPVPADPALHITL